MPRDWAGSVYRSVGRETYAAKWKEWGTERWRKTLGFASRSEARDFLTRKRKEYRERRSGTFDAFAEHRGRAIEFHVAAFEQHILGNRRRRAGKRTTKHARLSKTRLLTAFQAMAVKTLVDLTGSKADLFLNRLLDVQGRSVKTRNDYCAVLKQFAKWAEGDYRVERDPFRNLRFIENVAGPRKRQTLTWQQVRELAAACVQRALQTSKPAIRERLVELGRRRAMTVMTMFLTGLRNNELAGLRWSWIDLASSIIVVPHDVSKSGRTEAIPLHDGLAQLLRAERTRRGVASGKPVTDDELVIGEMVNGEPKLPRHVNTRLRADAEWVSIPPVDEAGRPFSVYSLRTSFSSQLTELGVPDGVVSELMRHKPKTVTQRHYVQRSSTLMLQAINMIPREVADYEALLGGPNRGPNQVRNDERRCASESDHEKRGQA